MTGGVQAWRIDTPRQTLVLASDGGIPWAAYWGPALPPGTDPAAIADACHADVTSGMIDSLPPLSLCPEASTGFPGQPGLVVMRDGRMLQPRFALFATDGMDFTCRDDALGLGLLFSFECVGDTIAARSVLESDDPVTLIHLAAPVLPAPQSGQIVDFHGRWCGEFQPVRTPWQPGARLREARNGRSGHEHPPLAFLTGDATTNTQGRAHGMHYGWPGGHVMIAEELPDGRRQIQWGHARGSEPPGTRFETAQLYLSVSDSGMNSCAVAFQRLIRDHISRPATPRRLHYNCWEAVYFDHDLATLRDIADRAAALGAERFVLDDGWFGRRDDDTTSLGDWQIDRRKWPDGLTPLIEHVQARGMSFGLWFEPEMISPDSDLARAHPDWVLGPADQPLGRQQLALDMARADVRDHLFAAIDAVLSANAIDYVKWDHNRLLPLADADQARGILTLLHRIRTAHPGVEIETCASGGGRIDAGILALTGRVWLSDSNDALERLRIQHDAALLLPAAVTGSHVGPRHCHTSGRDLPIELRAWTAAQRQMGFEMDPRELTDAEAATLTAVTAWWRDNRDWMMAGDILRLDTTPDVIAETQIAADGSRFVAFHAQMTAPPQILPRPLRLTGLDPDASYRVALTVPAPGRSRGPVAIKTGPLVLPGAFLMAQGLTLPSQYPQTLAVIEGQRL